MINKQLNKTFLLRRLLLIAAVSPLVLLWGELFVRILLPQNVDSKMNIYASDPVIGFTYKPNGETYEKGREYNALYQINSHGLRDREYGEKKDGTFRVLLLGDSFSASHGLPIGDSLSRQLERALLSALDSQEIPVRIEVINTAVGGYSPYNYWKAYRRWASVFEPDVVILGVSPDDYDCTNAEVEYVIEDGMTLAFSKKGQKLQKRRTGVGNSIKKLRKWFSWNSEFYILMRNFIYYNELVGRITNWMDANAEAQVNQLQQYLVPQPESMNKAWAKTFSYLRNLNKETAADGVMFMVVPIPTKLEIDTEEYQRTLTASGLLPEQVDSGQVLRQISAFSKEENIPVLDPREAIRQHHTKVPCYFIYDGHWNAIGIQVAVASIVRQWIDLGLPPWSKTLPDK